MWAIACGEPYCVEKSYIRIDFFDCPSRLEQKISFRYKRLSLCL